MCRITLLVLNSLALLFLTSCAKNLPEAAEFNNISEIQALLREGSPIDQRGGKMDETALIIAARKGNLDIARTLLKAGADINARTKYDDTALTAATYFCHPNVAKFLIEQGADVNAKNAGYGSTPLMNASECNDLEIVKSLIKKGAKVNEQNKCDESSLMAAALKGYSDIVQALLAAGADPNLVFNAKNANMAGRTALMAATHNKHKDIVALLLASGADPNIKDKSGKTALDYADPNIAQLLRQAGAKD